MLTEFLLHHRTATPDKTALIVGEESLTYQELSDTMLAFAEYLHSTGVCKGTHIMMLLGNSVEFTVSLFASAHLGAVIIPLDSTLNDSAITAALQATDATHAIASNRNLQALLDAGLNKERVICIDDNPHDVTNFQQAIRNGQGTSQIAPPELSGDEAFILSMTSGSTAAPKPVIFSQNAKINRAQMAQACYGLDANIVALAATPQYHSLAQRLTILPIMLGGTAVVMPNFTPKAWLQTVEKYRVSFSMSVSSQLNNILQQYQQTPYNLSSLQVLVSSSAAISATLKQKLMDVFACQIHEIYGTSEVATLTNLAPEHLADSQNMTARLNSVGKAMPNVELKIVDAHDTPLPIGEIGEIICTSPARFSGYYKLPNVTQDAMRGGYFHTGDLGKLDDEGFLTFIGRKKELIISGGINIYPQDIEKILMESGLLTECAVIGIDDAYFGEAILAVIVPQNNNDDSAFISALTRQLRLHCLKELADYQQPLGYQIMSELPRNAMSKIMKPTLRDSFNHLDLTQQLRQIMPTTSHVKNTPST